VLLGDPLRREPELVFQLEQPTAQFVALTPDCIADPESSGAVLE
jgi:hypothetical protein